MGWHPRRFFRLARLVDLIDEFGGEIEADLADRGHDLLDWFRGVRPWPQLERFIDNLPVHSRYGAALVETPDVVAELLRQEDEPAADMTLVGFDATRSLLTALVDAVNNNTAAVIAAAGADPPDLPPMPRPVTELDRARERAKHAARQSLADLAMGRTTPD